MAPSPHRSSRSLLGGPAALLLPFPVITAVSTLSGAGQPPRRGLCLSGPEALQRPHMRRRQSAADGLRCGDPLYARPNGDVQRRRRHPGLPSSGGAALAGGGGQGEQGGQPRAVHCHRRFLDVGLGDGGARNRLGPQGSEGGRAGRELVPGRCVEYIARQQLVATWQYRVDVCMELVWRGGLPPWTPPVPSPPKARLARPYLS